MKKKILSLLLAAVILLGMIPTSAFAESKTEITVYVTVFNKGEFCKDKNNEAMWQKAVTVTDKNNDGKFSLDEALSAAHAEYNTNGASAYGTEYDEYYHSTSVIKLWGIDTYSTGYYRNNVMTAAVDQEFLNADDKITAFSYYDETAWSDRYSFFTEETKTVNVNTEFSLTLNYAGYDAFWNPANMPVATAPIGVYDIKTGVYSVPASLKGEHIFGNFYMKASTGTDGSVNMQFTEIGKYYVTAQYNSGNYMTYDYANNQVPNYLVPPICTVTVIDENIKNVISKINRIGTVTENSGTAVNEARAAYDALNETQRELVDNYNILTASEAAYNKILTDKADKEKAEGVVALIDAIGMVTAESGEEIKNARDAYDVLTDVQKTIVSNISVLTKAETDYNAILTEKENKEKADNVITLINAIGTVTAESQDKISTARSAYNALNDGQKALVTNYGILNAAETAFADINAKNIKSSTEKYLLTSVPEAAYGAEWAIIALSRNNADVPQDYYENYYNSVANYVKENIKDGDKLSVSKSTDNSRVIVALTAIGKDPTNVGGHNLLTALSNFDYVKAQGPNGLVWALIALDTRKFDIPSAEQGATQTTRELLIDSILNSELANGGWTFSGNVADPDMTGMAIQALAPYYKTNNKVKTAVDKAVNTLSAMQQADGGFASWGTASAESASQVITALSAIGIDCNTDVRFIKNGYSVYDALLSYYAVGGGFKSAYTNTVDTYTTCQAFYSIAAYNRFKANEAPLYDMSDVDIVKPDNENENKDNTVNDNKNTNTVTDNQQEDINTDANDNKNPDTVTDAENDNNPSVPSDDINKPSPSTGDNSNIIIWIALLLVSTLNLSAIVFKKRKNL